MKIKFLILFFAIVFQAGNNFNLFGQTPDELMKLGNKYFQDGLFDNAVNEYQKIISQGYESSSLYYNLGNAYFKIGKIGRAIFNYEKALKIEPGNDDALYNLRIANIRTVDKITEVPKLFLVEWWELLITAFTFSGWSIITVIIYLIFIIGLGFYFLSKKIQLQKIGFLISSSSLAVLIISVMILISRYNYEAATDYGILFEQIYTVKSSPDTKSNDAFVIHEGIKFTIEDKVENWVKIKLADGKIGWIPNNVFGQI